MIRVFIGFDSKETVAYNVLQYSIMQHSTQPVSSTPVAQHHLKELFWRTPSPLQSTAFAFSRFLIPALCEYQGWAIFMDCDMLVFDDIQALWALRDDRYAVMCVQHKHAPTKTKKFLDQVQTQYEKKNWSSLMLINCAACTQLTPEYVNTASGLDLHQFKWLDSDERIGTLPKRWNHLVDYDPHLPISDISNLHFTEGGPYFDAYKNCSYATEWHQAKHAMLHVVNDEEG